MTGLVTNIDEIRFIYTNNNLILDDPEHQLRASPRTRRANPLSAISLETGRYVEDVSAAVLLDSGLNATVTDDSFDLFEGGFLSVAVPEISPLARMCSASGRTDAGQLSTGMTRESLSMVSKASWSARFLKAGPVPMAKA